MGLGKRLNTIDLWKNLHAGGPAMRGVVSALAMVAVVPAGHAQTNTDTRNRDFTPAPPLRLKSDFLGYSVSVSPRVGYSDNINLVPQTFLDNAPEDFVDDEILLSTLTTANAIVSTRRFTGLISGDLDLSYLTNSEDFVVNQRIVAAGTATIAENLAYLDIAGGSTRQLIGENAAFSQNPSAARGERANVYTVAASPYLFREFSDQSSAELRYRFSQSFVDDANSNTVQNARAAAETQPDFDPDDFSDFLNNSQTHEVLARYESGRLLDRFLFVATAYGNSTEDTGSDFLPEFSFEQGSLTLEGQYALTRKFALSGAVGYDEIDTNGSNAFFDDDDLSGVFWRAGFVLRPGRRTRAQLEYGRRFDDDFIQADIAYQISRRFLFTANANRSFQTRSLSNAQQISQNSRVILDFADNLRAGGEGNPRGIIDQAVQLAGVATGGLNAQLNGFGPTNNASVRLAGEFGKSVLSIGGLYQQSDFGFREFESLAVTLDLTHNLSRKVTIYGNVLYRFADDGIIVDNCVAQPEFFLTPDQVIGSTVLAECLELDALTGTSNTLSESIGLTYQLGRRTRAFGQYARTDRFSEMDNLDFTENALSAGVIIDF